MGTTLYFPNNNNNIKKVLKELSKNILFEQKFKFKKDIYLENQKYLIVISKKFIRVLIFDNKNTNDINDIKRKISNINIGKK